MLSGMNTMDQIIDNMRDMAPVTPEEMKVIEKVRNVLEEQNAIACTGCRYCVSECPQGIAIPDYFRMYNEYQRYPNEGWKIEPVYQQLSAIYGKASSCITCRKCEAHCPQHLAISAHLKKVVEIFE